MYIAGRGLELGLDTSRIGIGGFSSGGNLAASVSQRAAHAHMKLVFVVLSVPVTDNTAGPQSFPSWKENRNCPGLNDAKMLWCEPARAGRPHSDRRPGPVSP